MSSQRQLEEDTERVRSVSALSLTDKFPSLSGSRLTLQRSISYVISTEDNFKSDELDFYGPFAHIRASLDYSYHQNYKKERQMLQDEIITKFLHVAIITDVNGFVCTTPTEPWIVFTAGAMGAGKSYTIRQLKNRGLFPLMAFVGVDPDEIRRDLPEFHQYVETNPLAAGELTRKEAGYISEVLTLAALEKGKNVIVDGSLRDAGWYKGYFERLRSEYKNLKIAILHITAPEHKIFHRAMERGKKTGRVVPTKTIKLSLEQVPKSVKILKDATDYTAVLHNEDEVELLTEGQTWESFQSQWAQTCAWKPSQIKKRASMLSPIDRERITNSESSDQDYVRKLSQELEQTSETEDRRGVPDLLDRSSLLFGDRQAICIDNDTNSALSFIDTSLAAKNFTKYIQHLVQHVIINTPSYQQPPHEVILAFISPNTPEFLLTMIASMASIMVDNKRIKLIPALLNVRWSSKEMAAALAQKPGERISLGVFYHPLFYSAARDLSIDLKNDCSGVECLFCESIPSISSVQSSVTGMPDNDAVALNNNDNDEIALILFTSGTISGSKGVCLSHRSILIQALAKLCNPCSFDSQNTMLVSVPLFHVGGLSSALAILLGGGRLLFFNYRKKIKPLDLLQFSIPSVLDMIRKDAFNTLVVVPAMLHTLLAGRSDIFPEMKMILVGGQSLSATLLDLTKKVFPRARIVQTFACSEAGSSITFACLTNHETSFRKVKSEEGCCNSFSFNVGSAPAHIEIRILPFEAKDDEKNFEFSRNIGCICTRGPHIMDYYWPPSRHDEQNIGALLENGWLKTGDLGFIDEAGQLFFCGRSSDTIRTGGETVLAQEVDQVISKHPNVDDCFVFPLPNERFGEAVSVAIILNDPERSKYDGSLLDEYFSETWLHKLRVFCLKSGLADYKKPKNVFVLSHFPQNSSGKVERRKILSKCSQILVASMKSKI